MGTFHVLPSAKSVFMERRAHIAMGCFQSDALLKLRLTVKEKLRGYFSFSATN